MKTVLAHGCFDMLHLGHIEHLQAARQMGDHLTVSVTADEHVHKGMGRPHFTAEQRAAAVRALGCVDNVIINSHSTSIGMINLVKPDIYCKGIDYDGATTQEFKDEIDAMAALGGEVRITPTKKLSSSRLIAFEKFGDDVAHYFEVMRDKGGKEKILWAFEQADAKRILFVGERILDVYQYVQGLGRASKELMLATVEVNLESFDGGVVAASKHGDWPMAKIVSSPHEMVKLRYVDSDFNRKILDVYDKRYLTLDEGERDDLRAQLEDAIGWADVTIVLDFGHGLLGRFERRQLQHAGWLAVNAQTNAGNYGFNPVSNYDDGAKFVCIDEPEARLAVQDQFKSLYEVTMAIETLNGCHQYLITRGRNGAFWRNGFATGEAPPLAHGGIDTMGAGDAVMAVTAPLVHVGLELELAAFVGNIVGAIKIGTVGHRTHVKRGEIIQTVEALLA